MRAIYNTPHEAFPLLCFTPYSYACPPTSAHRGFQYGYRHRKDNILIIKVTLSSWKNLAAHSILTLYNIHVYILSLATNPTCVLKVFL